MGHLPNMLQRTLYSHKLVSKEEEAKPEVHIQIGNIENSKEVESEKEWLLDPIKACLLTGRFA